MPVLFAAATATAAPPPDPLPKGATARLGSVVLFGDRLQALTFSADGKQLLAPDGDKLFAWDPDTGRALPTRPLPGGGTYAPATAGGRLFSGGGGGVVVRELADGREVSRIPCDGRAGFENYTYPPQIPPLAVTPDGKYLSAVSVAGKVVEVYAVDTGKRLHAAGVEKTYGAGARPSPDGKTLYVREIGKPIRRWEVATGKALPDLAGTDGRTNLLDASPDGKWVLTRGAGVAKDGPGAGRELEYHTHLTVHDAAANRVVGKLDVGGRPTYFRFVGQDAVVVAALAVRPPGPFVFTLSRWDVAARKRDWVAPIPADGQIVVSPDGARIAVCPPAAGRIQVYDAATGKPPAVPPGHAGRVTWVGFSPAGDRVITADTWEVTTWGPDGGRKAVAAPPEIRDTLGLHAPALGGRLTWAAFGRDGKTADLVAWDPDKQAFAWRMPMGDKIPHHVLSHDGNRVVGVRADPARKAVVAEVYDGPAGKSLRTWDVPAGPEVRVFDGHTLPPLALSGDGAMLFVGTDDVVTGYATDTGKEACQVVVGPEKVRNGSRAEHRLAASADGRRIAVAQQDERTFVVTLRTFDVKTGRCVAEHELGKLGGNVARYSPDGKRVAVWGGAGTGVRVCDAESGRVKPVVYDGGVSRPTAAAFGPDGKSLVVGYQDGTALVWDLAAK
ncbi:MAG: hypothetical protein C0501_16340 [Isosphaera sp.]|nr:hypothetical protein [Isosphaera sp.]